MAPYLLVFVLPIVLFPIREKHRLVYVFAIAAAWSIFAGLRFEIGGTDYFLYEKYYTAISSGNIKVANKLRYEPLFKAVAAACAHVGTGYHGFLLVVALLGILPAVYVLDKRVGETPLVLFVYGIEWMFFGSFVILRQGVALGIAFLAYDAMFDKRYVRYFIAVACAAGFHYSALVLLALPFFANEKKPIERTAVYVAAGLISLAILAGSLFGAFKAKSKDLLSVLLLHYLTSAQREPLNMLNVAEVVAISFIVRSYAQRSRVLLRNAYFLYVCCVVVALEYAILLRFGLYFEIAFAFMVYDIVATGDVATIRKEKRENSAVWLSVAIGLYYLAKISRWLWVNAQDVGGFIPYRTIFS